MGPAQDPQVNPEVRLFVGELLRRFASFPDALRDTVVDALCRSLAPSTLNNYFRVVQLTQRHMHTEFYTWLPFTDTFVHALLAQLLAAKVSASAINGHMAALGTFASWAGFPRPRSELVSYVIKAAGKTKKPPAKTRVHDFKLLDAVRRVDQGVV